MTDAVAPPTAPAALFRGVRILQVPYDSAQRGVRMGRGPEHLVEHGAADALRARGRDVDVEFVEAPEGFRAEVATSFALYRRLAEHVRRTLGDGRFPLVLAGNCGSALGMLGALGPARTAVVWFDAHGDFNTPETSASGFLDGMALAIATGHCWAPLRRSLWADGWGDAVVPEAHVAHVGGRDFDAAELDRLGHSAVAVVRAEAVRAVGARAALGPIVERLAPLVDAAYVHLDLDALDPGEAPANEFLSAGGLSASDVADAVATVAARLPLRGAALTAYDPAYDPDGRTLRAAITLIDTIVDAALGESLESRPVPRSRSQPADTSRRHDTGRRETP